MSSQGANTTTLNTGYVFNPASERDASDITRTIREKAIVAEITGIDYLDNKYPKPIWMKYGNGFRVSLLYGIYKFNCGQGTCAGNVFGLNGVP